MVVIVAEPGLDDPASLVPCFKIEGSGLSLVAFTYLPVEDVALAEVDGVSAWGKTVRKSESATVGWWEELVSFKWISLNILRLVAGSMFKRTVGFCALPSKSPVWGTPYWDATENPILGARKVGSQP